MGVSYAVDVKFGHLSAKILTNRQLLLFLIVKTLVGAFSEHWETSGRVVDSSSTPRTQYVHLVIISQYSSH